jgi:hypothetical protein
MEACRFRPKGARRRRWSGGRARGGPRALAGGADGQEMSHGLLAMSTRADGGCGTGSEVLQ